jgi:hypothetical protein
LQKVIKEVLTCLDGKTSKTSADWQLHGKTSAADHAGSPTMQAVGYLHGLILERDLPCSWMERLPLSTIQAGRNKTMQLPVLGLKVSKQG